MAINDLRKNGMMAHLLDALGRGTDIGHNGRLVFAIVARHFVDEAELVNLLTAPNNLDEHAARALVLQVQDRGYSPPRPETIRLWQQRQEFPICPTECAPDGCNVYKELQFPDGVYEHIQEYHEQRATCS